MSTLFLSHLNIFFVTILILFILLRVIAFHNQWVSQSNLTILVEGKIFSLICLLIVDRALKMRLRSKLSMNPKVILHILKIFFERVHSLPVHSFKNISGPFLLKFFLGNFVEFLGLLPFLLARMGSRLVSLHLIKLLLM